MSKKTQTLFSNLFFFYFYFNKIWLFPGLQVQAAKKTPIRLNFCTTKEDIEVTSSEIKKNK